MAWENYGRKMFLEEGRNMDKIVNVLVEGECESSFVKQLNTHFKRFSLRLKPVLIETALGYKGGYVTYAKFKKQIRRLFNDRGIKAATMMFDYYNFSMKDRIFSHISTTNRSCYDIVYDLENTISNDIENRQFIPFLFLHEFETMLFVSPEKISSQFPGYESDISSEIQLIKKKFNNLPETINDNTATSPSHRIGDIIKKHTKRNYDKIAHGIIALMDEDIGKIRSECPHFDSWIKKLEGL